MSKYIRPLWVAILICSIGVSVTSAGEFYVAPNGDDANPGTKQQPFASLRQAGDAVRQFKKANPKKDITVLLRGGVYHLTETVVFALEDSGSPDQTVAYKAYPGETAILSGGVPVKQWNKLTSYPKELPQTARGKVWVADVSFVRELKKKQKPSPTVATQMDRSRRFFTLYQGSRRLQRARGKRFFLVKKPPQKITDNSTFAFPEGMVRNWPDISDAEIAFIPQRSWISNILPIEQVDEAKGIARTSVPGTYTLQRTWTAPETATTQIENVLALLDEPGEWVLDSRSNKLYLWPLNGTPGDDIVAPVLTELIRVEGRTNYSGPKDIPVKNLVFRGLTFIHGDRFPWHGKTGWGLQHDWERFDSPSAMLRFRGAENCAVEDCHFTTAGCTGIRFDLYSQKNRVVGNHFEHLGGVGILFAGYGPGTKNVNRKNIVENNLIHHIGELYHGSPALFVWQSGENRIAHNLIHDVPYAGICVTGRIIWDTVGVEECSRTIRWHEVGGIEIAKKFRDKENMYHKLSTWEQREKFLHSRNNIVERNDIHHVMQVCGDGNCIYISGTGNGNLILENYCHDCPSQHMNTAIRCDDDQKGTTIKRNIIFRTGGYAEGLLIKGKNDLLENLLVDLRTGSRHRGYMRFYDGDVDSSVIQRNVFYSCEKNQFVCHDGYARRGKPAPRLRNTKADYNLYFCTKDSDWGTRHLIKERPNGIEKHSVSADPLFYDIDKGDFRFMPGSPALKLGIKQPILIDEVGLQTPYRERWNHK